jgi:serine/threonine protein kinase
VIACQLCETENTDDSRFCKGCGARLEMEPTELPEDGPATTAVATPRLREGSVVAQRYRIDGMLGEGGMGLVYRATELGRGRQVAIKQLNPAHARSPLASERFRREIEVAKKLDHPNLVRLFDSGRWEEASYLAMEYVDGWSLKQKIRERKTLELEFTVPLLLQLCEGLEAIHAAGVVHRDVKPANVLVDRSGQVKLCDFGLAFTEGLGLTRITRTGVAMGTPEYMAPEQIEGERVDTRTDIYALGVLMYEAFTGDLPFIGDNLLNVAMQHLNRAPLPPALRNPALPTYLERIILKAMEKDPAKRFQAVAEVRAELTTRRRAAPRKPERHPVTGDFILEEQSAEGLRLSIYTRHERQDWCEGVALFYNNAFYELSETGQVPGSSHPYAYTFAPWPDGVVLRRIVNYGAAEASPGRKILRNLLGRRPPT